MSWNVFVRTERVGKKLYQPPWSKEETMDGHLCREHTGITYLGMWVRPESFGPNCANLLCPARPFLKSGETQGSGHKMYPPRGERAQMEQEFVHRSRSGKSKDTYLPHLQTLPLTRRGNTAHSQPVPTRIRWVPPAVGLADIESPQLCQRLDVAGGDTTKAPGCASWVPAA